MNKVELNNNESTAALPSYSSGLFLLFLGLALAIWFTHSNQTLFILINSYHALMPDTLWNFFNLISYSRFLILPLLLVLLSYWKRREQLLTVIVIILAYFAVFSILKSAVGEARPYVVLPENSFFWLNHFEDAAKSAHKSFPSGHTGNMAIFVFTLNCLFFAHKKGYQFLMLLLLIATALTRVISGWHWPVDVIASGLIAYLLVKICFAINFTNRFLKN